MWVLPLGWCVLQPSQEQPAPCVAEQAGHGQPSLCIMVHCEQRQPLACAARGVFIAKVIAPTAVSAARRVRTIGRLCGAFGVESAKTCVVVGRKHLRDRRGSSCESGGRVDCVVPGWLKVPCCRRPCMFACGSSEGVRVGWRRISPLRDRATLSITARRRRTTCAV